MSLKFNLRHLEQKNLFLRGELPAADLELENVDELIRTREPLAYVLEVQTLEDGILVHGSLRLNLECDCARCLKPFQHQISLEDWASHLPLEGEDKVEIVNDSVDLTPYLREDILLSFPQHPLCEPDCKGLSKSKYQDLAPGEDARPESEKVRPDGQAASSTWAELNKLKF
jgi:uncharacterized metal-binding protein YceD (DUF177 family)